MCRFKLSAVLRRLMLLLTLVCLLCVGGAYAAWVYFLPAAPTADSLPTSVGLFLYQTEVILPNDVPLEHHSDLIGSILENVKGGLNSSKDTLENALKKDSDKIVYSEQKVTGGNLDLVTKDSANLDFVCHMVGDLIYCYTYSSTSADGGTPASSRIEVYLTLFRSISTSKWEIVGSQRGSAYVMRVSSEGFNSVDISTWNAE